MNYAILGDVIQDTVEALVRLGVARSVAESEMHGVEWAALADLTEADKDQRLLDLCSKYETKDVAERYGKSPRTIRDMRTQALNRQSARRMAAA